MLFIDWHSQLTLQQINSIHCVPFINCLRCSLGGEPHHFTPIKERGCGRNPIKHSRMFNFLSFLLSLLVRFVHCFIKKRLKWKQRWMNGINGRQAHNRAATKDKPFIPFAFTKFHEFYCLLFRSARATNLHFIPTILFNHCCHSIWLLALLL